MAKAGVCAVVALFALMVHGCSARNAYESLRIYQEMNCEKLIGSDREECLRRGGMSYDEYQKHLKKRQDAPNN